MEVSRVHAHFDIGCSSGEAHGALVQLERLHELAREILDPRDELQALGMRGVFAARQREHAFDDLAHAARVRRE